MEYDWKKTEHANDRATEQSIVLVRILTVMGKRHVIRDIYLQDPTCTEIEEQLIQSLGFTVLRTIEALSKKTPTTLVFVPCANMPLLDIFEKCHAVITLASMSPMEMTLSHLISNAQNNSLTFGLRSMYLGGGSGVAWKQGSRDPFAPSETLSEC